MKNDKSIPTGSPTSQSSAHSAVRDEKGNLTTHARADKKGSTATPNPEHTQMPSAMRDEKGNLKLHNP